MDLVDALRNKISGLGNEQCVPGLKAVLLHIVTAFRHLSRGQEQSDDTAFTDAIYRTNQAFEGSIKEAYRVLANKDPDKKKPYQIESYLEEEKVFRPRVLSQLTNYRTEWRNPSAHDYQLNFDESEAFLAIVSVSAFSCLLLDQIAERIAYKVAQADAEAEIKHEIKAINAAKEIGLLDWVAELAFRFLTLRKQDSDSPAAGREAQLIGGISGYLSTIAPELVSTAYQKIGDREADLVIARGEDKVLVEFKNSHNRESLRMAIYQIIRATRESKGEITKGLVVIGPPQEKMTKIKVSPAIKGIDIIVIFPDELGIPEDVMHHLRETFLY